MLGATFITLLMFAISSAVVGYVSLLAGVISTVPSLVPTADVPAAERGNPAGGDLLALGRRPHSSPASTRMRCHAEYTAARRHALAASPVEHETFRELARG
jgi:hypothetical protein